MLAAVHALPDRRAGAAARRPLAEGVTAQSKIIYADQIAPGWAFHSLAAESHSTNLASNWTDSPGVGINRSSAICTTLQASVCCLTQQRAVDADTCHYKQA